MKHKNWTVKPHPEIQKYKSPKGGGVIIKGFIILGTGEHIPIPQPSLFQRIVFYIKNSVKYFFNYLCK